MTPTPKIAYLVSHTHWDREWYLPFQQFRSMLTRTVRHVLDELEKDGAFRHFVLDGQTILLEDHLAIHPGDAPRIRALVERGALAIGPWYILPDEFLVSGEATVRNLLIGHRVGVRFGGVQKVGYLPDSFGHIAQLPQILARAGIDSFIYTRGNGDELEELGLEFQWEAPDGSQVTAIHQCLGYCNAAALGFPELWQVTTRRKVDTALAVARVRELFAAMAHLSNGDVWLLNNGCDHHPPQRDIQKVLTALEQAFPETRFVHGSFPEYLDAAGRAPLAAKRYRGELLGARYHPILSGVWSARMYLKQQNDLCQTLLASYVEPLASYAAFHGRAPYASEAIEAAWKLLLQNHPHDSICGCSTDEVHAEMEIRFAGVRQSAQQLIDDALETLLPTFDRGGQPGAETALCVFNPLPRERSEVVERLVLVPRDQRAKCLRLVDAEGHEVPCEIEEIGLFERFWGVDYRRAVFVDEQLDRLATVTQAFGARMRSRARKGEGPADRYLLVRFLARDLPAVGAAIYHLLPVAAGVGVRMPEDLVVGDDTLENAFCRLRLHPDGTFDLLDKRTGHEMRGLNVLEDGEDIGDEYDYSPCPHPQVVSSAGARGKVRIVTRGRLCGRLEAEHTLKLPERITADRSRRSRRRVSCRVRTRVTLWQHRPGTEVELELDNRARDHRLRAQFPTGIATGTLISDGHFHVIERPFRREGGAGWVQPPPETHPQQEYSLVTDGRRGVALLARGLPEVAAHRDASGCAVIALTLLRAVGWLSRDDFVTRNSMNAGPTLPTPDAQCLGTQRFRYAVVPFAGDPIAADVKTLSARFRTPPLCKQGDLDGSWAAADGLVRCRSRKVCISAIKRHATRDTLVVRLYNLTNAPVEERLEFGLAIRRAWRVTLLEGREDELRTQGQRALPLHLGPCEILTVEVELTAGDTGS